MNWLTDPQAWLALATLTALEIVLGIDNIIFISILVSRLPRRLQQRARLLGLGLAMGMRILLLLSLTWVMSLTAPWFTLFGQALSGRDLILIGGGLFLLVKSTFEIHHSLEAVEDGSRHRHQTATFAAVLLQIAALDVIFSLDSVITAVGLAQHLPVMIIAIVVAVLVMMFSARPIGEFVESHPTLKMLALSFLILIGVSLIAEGLDLHIPKGYIYFSMAFSFCVEMLNLKLRRRQPIRLRTSPLKPADSSGGDC